MTSSRRDYLVAWRWLRLGVRVPLRIDAGAPLAVWAAACAAPDARRTDPLSVPLRTRLRARALAQGLGVGRLVTLQRLPLPLDPIPPAAGPAALVPAGLPAPTTAQAHPPVQPGPFSASDFCSCDICDGSGCVPIFFDQDEFQLCAQCGGSGMLYVDPEPEPTPAKLLALSLVDCLQAIDDFYNCQVSGADDLHTALKSSAKRARQTLSDLGYPLSRWPF